MKYTIQKHVVNGDAHDHRIELGRTFFSTDEAALIAPTVSCIAVVVAIADEQSWPPTSAGAFEGRESGRTFRPFDARGIDRCHSHDRHRRHLGLNDCTADFMRIAAPLSSGGAASIQTEYDDESAS
jgi:hypothetical protein